MGLETGESRLGQLLDGLKGAEHFESVHVAATDAQLPSLLPRVPASGNLPGMAAADGIVALDAERSPSPDQGDEAAGIAQARTSWREGRGG